VTETEFVPPKGFKPNPGKCPKAAEGKRVRVILRHSMEEPPYSDANTQAVPGGWAADGRGGCRWSIINSPWDILFYRIM
jgi:hypothetical protein